MINYSASYINGDSNFTIQNVTLPYKPDHKKDPIICILKNILQRGNPTTMSSFLQSKINCMSGVDSEKIYLNSEEVPRWHYTIKGDQDTGYNPAYEFYYNILPNDLREYKYIQNLIIPECRILDITRDRTYASSSFTNREVDFYLPQAKLVIEIDGFQHGTKGNYELDKERDRYLAKYGINTVRIRTSDLNEKNNIYYTKIDSVISRLEKYKDVLYPYKKAYEKFELNDSFKATAVMRWQLTILSMIEAEKLKLSSDIWDFEVKDHEKSETLDLAIKDIFLWLRHLYKLNKLSFNTPKINVKYVEQFSNKDSIKIDFSLRKRWTDENQLNKDIIYVRSDYFDSNDYFTVSVADPINYQIVQEGEESDVPSLEFFLMNIFGHSKFQDGQLPVIINALSGRNTVGLLPTGGGKSLCYQLSVLLQPSISYVVVPIKSLMYDQIDNLRSTSINRIHYISGDQNANEKSNIQNKFAHGKYLFIIISPERFQLQEFRDYLEHVNKKYTVAHAVIDEVHCLSEWGHDFRVSYLHLCQTIKRYSPTAKLLGLSATASINVLKDIKVEFGIDNSDVKTLLEYKREELNFNIQIIDDPNLNKKYEYVCAILNKLNSNSNMLEKSEKYKYPGLIFTLNVNGGKGCFELSNQLSNQLQSKIPWYSGDIPKNASFTTKEFQKYKWNVQEEFKVDKYPLMIATKAFGMGVDKKNIRYTIHYSLPGSLESLYQEAGRAGRDKNKATNFILYSRDTISDEEYNKLFQLNSSVEEINELLKSVGFKRQGDILSNFFLWMQNNQGVNKETSITKKIFKKYAKPGITSIISCSELGLNFNETQKGIYRLSLLGIIKDWVINGYGVYGSFEVFFNNFNEKTYKASLLKYFRKYEPSFDLEEDSNENYRDYIKIYTDDNLGEIEKCIRILIQWTYDNIFYNRRQSLKNLIDYCVEYKDDKEMFKQKIESYFKFTESSYFIDHIAQHPDDYRRWFEILYDMESQYLVNSSTLTEIRIALIRFLENYRYNTGLNFLSGLTRLMTNEFNEIDGQERLVAAFNNIKDYEESEKEEILIETLKVGETLDLANKINLSQILCQFYPNRVIVIHEYLQDNNSLELALKEINNKLQGIGDQYYGTLG